MKLWAGIISAAVVLLGKLHIVKRRKRASETRKALEEQKKREREEIDLLDLE